MNHYTKRYALLGALFGASFPVLSTFVDAWFRIGSVSLDALVTAHTTSTLHLVIDTAPIFLGAFAAIAGRAQDSLQQSLSELQATYEKLETAHSALRAQSESLQAALDSKSAFLARMSHELRTPLNVIIGFSRIVLERAGDELSPRPKRHIGMVLDSGEQLLHLVNDMLDLERIDSGRVSIEKRTTDVGALLQSIYEASMPAVEKAGLKLNLEIPDDGLFMETDVDRLRQVVTNLLNNAIKYAEKGEIFLKASAAEDAVVLEVSDTGVGIPEEHLDKIFDAFHQVDGSSARSKDGTGLGLSIVQKLTELLGGTVTVESKPGEGACFRVRFPVELLRASTSQVDNGIDDESLDIGRGRGSVVLVIDDKKALLELVRHELAEAGFRVHVASSGKAGLEKARALKPDVIVLDIIMPEMDGWEVLRRLRADPDLSKIRVVISSMLDDAPRAADFAVDAWLTKPVDPEEFARVLRDSTSNGAPDVLVVEDDPGTRALIEASLRDLNARIRMSEDGKSALAALDDRRPDAIVLDLGLPDMSGFELLARIRKREDANGVMIIVYTGAELSDEERKQLQGDLVAVVHKHSSSGIHSMVELVAAAVGE